MNVPPPAPSPRPPSNPDERHDTGEHPVTKGEMRRAFRLNEIWTALVAVGVAMSAVFGLYRLALSEARAEGREGAEIAIATSDAGAKGREARIAVLEQQRGADRGENNARFERLEASQARTEKKLDAILDRLDVPNPAPTPAKDGGP